MILLLVISASISVGLLIRRYIGLTNIANPIVPLYYYHTIFFLIALIYVERYNHVVVSQNVIYMVLYGYVVLFSSAILFSRILGVRHGTVVATTFVKNISSKSTYILSAYILQTIVLVVMLFFYYQKGILILSEDADNYRVEARKGLGFAIVLFRWISEIFVVICSLNIFASKRRSSKQVFLFFVYFVVTFVFMLGLGSRAFVLELLVIVLAIFYWSRCRSIDYKMIIYGLGLFALLGLLGAFRQGHDLGSLVFLEKAIWRPFVNIQNFQWIVDDFSDHSLLYGQSFFIEIKTLLPGYQPNFGTWYKEEFEHIFSGGSVTISYLGEAFANFGHAGVLAFPLVIGFVIASIGHFFGKKATFFWVFMSIMTSLSLKGIISVGVGATLVGTVLPVVFSLCLLFSIRLILKTIA